MWVFFVFCFFCFFGFVFSWWGEKAEVTVAVLSFLITGKVCKHTDFVKFISVYVATLLQTAPKLVI